VRLAPPEPIPVGENFVESGERLFWRVGETSFP
jgi:hypothetical protein